LSQYKTQVDVVFRPEVDDGRHLVFIEVKLSETDFGHCRAYQSDRNSDRHPCAQPHPFGSEPRRCFQLRNHDQGHPRRYLNALGELSGTPAGLGCWFRLGNNQVMRNVALARALIEADETDTVTVALCAPRGHRAIWRRWKEAKAALVGVTGIYLAELAADDVASVLPLLDGFALADRYLLDPGPIRMMAECRSWQEWLDNLFPSGAAYVAETPGVEGLTVHYVGRACAGTEAGQPHIGIVPVLEDWYPSTSWPANPTNVNLEWQGTGCRLLMEDEPAHRAWLMTPDLVPLPRHIDAAYLSTVANHTLAPPYLWQPNPLDSLPDTGVGA
jgi:hypothetical protein